MKSFTHTKFLLGFSDIQISQVLDYCLEKFSIRDIEIVDIILMDMDDSLIDIEDDDLSSDEEDILPED